jgi:hypothetical protein
MRDFRQPFSNTIGGQNEGFGGLKNRLESGLFEPLESALRRLEKSLKNPILSITC